MTKPIKHKEPVDDMFVEVQLACAWFLLFGKSVSCYIIILIRLRGLWSLVM